MLEQKTKEQEVLLSSIPAFVYFKDIESKLITANKAFAEMVNTPVDQLPGKDAYDLFPKEQAQKFHIDDEKVMQSGKPMMDIVEQFTDAEGKTRWASSSKIPYWGEKGEVAGMVGITVDITELKQAEEALKREKEQAEEYLNIAEVMLATVDSHEDITLINNRGCEILGYRKEELKGKNWFDTLIPQRMRNEVRDVFRKLMTGEVKPSEYYENPLLTKDGEERLIAFHNTVVRDSDGQIVGVLFSGEDITERERGEEDLRRSEEKYRAIIENTVEGYFEIDLAGNFTFANDPICNNLGYTRDELIGMNNREYMDKQTARKVFEKFVEVYTTGIPARGFEFEVTRKDGTKLVTSSSVSLITDSQGQPTGFRGVVRNVTAEKQAEERLRQSEEKYRAILENIEDGYFEVDLAGNFTFGNDSLCKIHGYTKDEMIGINNRQYMDEKTAKRVYQLFNQVYTTGKPSKGHGWEIIRKDGTKRFVDGSVSLIRDAQGKRIGFRGIIRDITERKQAEQALRQSEARYRTILESIEHGYFEVDIRGNFTFFNDSMCQILEYTRDELIGMNNRQYMGKKYARQVYQTFNKVYTTGKPAQGFDWELIRKDGTKRIVEASISLIRAAEGKPTGFRGIARDITERRKAEMERKALEQRAQVASRLSTVGEMASGIVHEINNPLTSVVGFAEILAQQDLPEDARQYARIISDEGKRVTSIAGRLLNFARRQKPETLYTDINKLIEATLDLQTYEMTTGNIKVTAKLNPHLPRTMADPGQLQQVFLNIMMNARKEMRAAHGGGNLLIKTEALDDAIRISFKDDGPGIPKKNLERIFAPLFTTRKKGEGTGLGLSICQGIINSHNGKIYAESTLGKGATFIIELPVVARRRKTTQAGSAIDKPRRPARTKTYH